MQIDDLLDGMKKVRREPGSLKRWGDYTVIYYIGDYMVIYIYIYGWYIYIYMYIYMIYMYMIYI